VVLRQEHRAGEKMFVDWAGATIPIYDRETGTARGCLQRELIRHAQRLKQGFGFSPASVDACVAALQKTRHRDVKCYTQKMRQNRGFPLQLLPVRSLEFLQ
jgi:hypothetical protein